jgi:hypothetical protein
MKYSHQYGCLDDSRNELQQILKPLDATIGCRIARENSVIERSREGGREAWAAEAYTWL